MNVTNTTNDSDIITSTNMTLSNCANNEIIIDKIMPTIFLTISCGLSFLCLLSLMEHTLIRPLFKNK